MGTQLEEKLEQELDNVMNQLAGSNVKLRHEMTLHQMALDDYDTLMKTHETLVKEYSYQLENNKLMKTILKDRGII